MNTGPYEQFRLAHLSVVAAGAFNTQIIHPDWLIDVGILPQDAKPEILLDFDQPGLQMRCGAIYGTWTVRPDRLSIECPNADNRHPGYLLARVIELLKWTPIMAVGLNWRYDGSGKTISDRVPMPNTSANGYETTQKMYRVSLSKPNEALIRNLQVAFGNDICTFTANFHLNARQMVSSEIVAAIKNTAETGTSEVQQLANECFGIAI